MRIECRIYQAEIEEIIVQDQGDAPTVTQVMQVGKLLLFTASHIQYSLLD